MSSSPLVSIFSEQTGEHQRPYTFVLSVVMHGVAIGLIALGILFAPKVKPPMIPQNYIVRHLQLHTPTPPEPKQQAAKDNLEAPRPHPKDHTLPPGGSKTPEQPELRLITKAEPAKETLVQPDLAKTFTLPSDIPIPAVVLWNKRNSLAKTLVAPQPERPAVANVLPSIQTPNEEMHLADVSIPSSNLNQPQPILPSTSSPLVLHGIEQTPPAPLSSTVGVGEPTPAALLSLSDLKMTDGEINLAPVNQSAANSSLGDLTPGHGKNPSQPGNGNPGGTAGGKNTGQDSAAADKNGTGLGNQPTTTRITLPKEGQFGAVIVGSSLEEKYPETIDVWSGRLAYTVYLHLGLAKSWPLQYSVARESEAAVAGNVAHLGAPWPFTIVRPNLPPGSIDGDALFVHGFVNQAGRFESLSIVFPPNFPQAKFLLDALYQWKFRPAVQNGQEIKVEVLLIIPADSE